MAGLLDSIFNTDEGRFGLGLLALGQQPKSQGMAGLMGLLAAQDAATKAKADTAWQGETRGRQRKEWTQADAAAEAAARQKAAIPGLFSGGEGGGLGGFDVQQALNAGFEPKMIQELANLRNAGRAKVARTVEGMDENGRPVTYQVDEFGQRVGDGIGQWKAPLTINQGDRTTLLNPATMQTLGSLGINMSPSERDASARGWAGNNLAQQRLAMDKANSGDNGYTFNAQLGGYVPKTPGGQFVPLGGVPAGGQKLTESEAKHSLYLGQMREASAELAGPKARGAGPVGVAMTGSPITNWAAPEAAQIAGQAQRQWAEAYLRAKTGAAATAGEVENNIRTYFPVVGDDAATVKRKNIARAAAERDMELPAGRGVGRVGGAQGSWDAPPAASGGVQREFSMLPNAAQFDGKRMRAPDGTVYRSRNGQWAKE